MTRIVRYRDGDDWVYGIDRDETRHPMAKLPGAEFAELPTEWVQQPVEPPKGTVATFVWRGGSSHGAVIRGCQTGQWKIAGRRKGEQPKTWSEFLKQVEPGTVRDHDGKVIA